MNTKDADIIIQPAGAVAECQLIAQRLLDVGWTRHKECYPSPAGTPFDQLRAIRLHPSDSQLYFIELLAFPERHQTELKAWIPCELGERALRETFPDEAAALARRAGDGLAELLASPAALDQAHHAVTVGLLSGLGVSREGLRITGERFFGDLLKPLAQAFSAEEARLDTAAAREWVLSAPIDHPDWPLRWRTAWDLSPGDAGLRTAARHWLRAAPPAGGGWPFVWQALWSAYPGDAELRASAIEWLQQAPPDEPSWPVLWSELWETAEGDGQLVAMGREWVEKTPSRTNAAHVLRALQKN